MITHFKFVKNHERHIRKVALVSDSKVFTVLPHVAGHFIYAEIRHFASKKKNETLAWIENGSDCWFQEVRSGRA